MFKVFLFLLVSIFSSAGFGFDVNARALFNRALRGPTGTALHWKVGQFTRMQISSDDGSPTIVARETVTQETPVGFWIESIIEGQPDIWSIFYDRKTGVVTAAKWNGENIQLPNLPKATLISVGNEDVTVPSGSFSAVRVSSENPAMGNNWYVAWYSPDIPISGMAKWESDVRQVGQPDPGVTVTGVLLEFKK